MPLSPTQYVACPNGWTKLSDLYGDTVKNATGWLISARTQAIQWAVAATTPNISTGHPMATSDSQWFGVGDIPNIWFKNEVSATVGYLVITPTYAF
jgi:hypothetical protein